MHMFRQLLIVFVVVLLFRLPFLDQAIQGDDVYYLAGAQHAQIDPLHPNHARYAFLGEIIDMRGHPHPPLNAWVLAGLLAVAGDIREVPFHAAYILFSLVAAAAMLLLARRFTSRPILATLLFLATPALVINGNSLEADLPFLACWMASAALFVIAVDARSYVGLAAAAMAMVCTALAAYQSVVLVPILGLYLWMKRKEWRPAWLVPLIVPATLAAWQLWERAATGEMPLTVLGGYLQAYGLQELSRKLNSAAALTAHSAWLVFPLLALGAFRKVGLACGLLAAAGAAAAAFADTHPLFWASFGTGLLVILWCARATRREAGADTRFLAAWVLIFFASALVLFFAGSARYLLPIAAPVALLVSRALAPWPLWQAEGFAAQLALSLALSFVNYQHWDGYRKFAASLANELAEKRIWINGEWGLRYYFEAGGGLPLLRGQPVQPGDMVVSSELAFPIQFTTGGGELAPFAGAEIGASLPLRLSGLGSRSGYSSVAMGLRPFDIAFGPIDRLHAAVVVERRPSLSYLPMNAPEAASQIVSGVYDLEDGRWRWTGQRAVLLLKRPEKPSPLEVVFYIPETAPAREVSVALDGVTVAHRTYASPGSYTLASAPVSVASESPVVSIVADKTFSVPGDQRRLGVVLAAAGFKE